MLGSACTVNEPHHPSIAKKIAMDGYYVAGSVLDDKTVLSLSAALDRAHRAVLSSMGETRLIAAGERGVVRLPLVHEMAFMSLMQHPLIVDVVNTVLPAKPILHLQNGFALPPEASNDDNRDVFQYRFHQDFPRLLGGVCVSLNAMVTLTPFTEETGATRIIPGSHQKVAPGNQLDMLKQSIPVECASGSIIFFDSTLWHAAGHNKTTLPRKAVNHQYTVSYIKQQIDICRVLTSESIDLQSEIAKQLLGYFARIPDSLDAYYQAPEKRLYRSGQG